MFIIAGHKGCSYIGHILETKKLQFVNKSFKTARRDPRRAERSCARIINKKFTIALMRHKGALSALIRII